MKPMTLKQCRRQKIAKGLPLVKTIEEAEAAAGSQPRSAVSNMTRALSLHPWLNAPDDWARLEAALMVLEARQPCCPARSSRRSSSPSKNPRAPRIT